MKGKITRMTMVILGLLVALAFSLTIAQGQAPEGSAAPQAAMGTAFTYQGRLTDAGNPADGGYDFRFSLYDALSGGAQVGSTVAVGDVTVTDGLFTVDIDFGAVFYGTALWLEIGVREGSSTGSYTILSPRQALTATPYALGLLPGAVVSGTVTSGSGILNLSSNRDGLRVDSAGDDGVYVKSAGDYGVVVYSAGDDGVRVSSAGDDGVQVSSAGDAGVFVSHAGGDGIFVCSTGDETSCTSSAHNNGAEIGNTQGHGVRVDSAGWSGVYVYSAGNDGVSVFSASDDGVDVAGDDLAGNFRGDIQVSGSCGGCLLATFGVNTGDQPLEPGAVVTVQGAQPSTVDSVPMLWQVTQAAAGQPVVGVVGGWAELRTEEEPRPGEIGQQLIPREGPAKPGAYVTIIIYGPVQVQASSPAGTITPGAKLAIGERGRARALQTVAVDGVQLAESAPVIGIALSAPDADGLVWVLVNPQ